MSNIIVRSVTVDLSLTALQALEATERKMYLCGRVFIDMPRSTVREVDVLFFKVCRPNETIHPLKYYSLYNLSPVDPFTLASINHEDKTFADKYPNATIWTDNSAGNCYSIFDRWGGDRIVSVGKVASPWTDYWWYAGVCKNPPDLKTVVTS